MSRVLPKILDGPCVRLSFFILLFLCQRLGFFFFNFLVHTDDHIILMLEQSKKSEYKKCYKINGQDSSSKCFIVWKATRSCCSSPDKDDRLILQLKDEEQFKYHKKADGLPSDSYCFRSDGRIFFNKNSLWLQLLSGINKVYRRSCFLISHLA